MRETSKHQHSHNPKPKNTLEPDADTGAQRQNQKQTQLPRLDRMGIIEGLERPERRGYLDLLMTKRET